MIHKSHPYWHVRSIVENRPDVVSLSFSYYNYRPQTVEDHRVAWTVSRNTFLDANEIEALIENVPPDNELAFHSNALLENGEIRHVVMVDMSTSSRAHLAKLRTFLGDNFFQRIAWYASGRSFHGYGEDLLSSDDWVRFMGLLLLVNQPRLEPTVDPRWIGHRLLAGFSALRWTRNTAHYLLPPSLIDSSR